MEMCASIVEDFMLSLVAMCIERSVATILSNKYERNGIVLGLLLLASTAVGNFAAAYYVYSINDFKEKVLSMVSVPSAAVPKFNRLSELVITVSFICMVTFHALSRYNKKQCAVSSATLTTRYQTRENVVTTQFATHIATLQVLFIMFNGACGLLIRIFGPKFFSKKLYTSLRQICYTTPVFMAVLPIYSMHRLRYYRLNRDSNIRSIVMMESRGLAGTRNYDEAIGKAWQLGRQS
ncbi:hypothetical protein KIN20_001844 [Parelaphostrongylus tenuis]|uniref:G protein-coupled receptor n=1 Tax=Parelaphostrongylus tenuis TaxID=148309 RepID=A0AAD5QCL2_PARTN|nr:hypothetical protein KIN20_001844 [Parelaphostrongylus tenuis]